VWEKSCLVWSSIGMAKTSFSKTKFSANFAKESFASRLKTLSP